MISTVFISLPNDLNVDVDVLKEVVTVDYKRASVVPDYSVMKTEDLPEGVGMLESLPFFFLLHNSFC